ncbi:hypothetical protein GGU11DRAFT_755614, partial [Lentinula aff. detonsa]
MCQLPSFQTFLMEFDAIGSTEDESDVIVEQELQVVNSTQGKSKGTLMDPLSSMNAGINACGQICESYEERRAAVNSTDKVLKRRGHAKIIYGQPLYPVKSTPTIPHNGNDAEGNETATILRKHTTLVAEWEAVQDESKVLREELKEDEWLT